MNNRRAKDLQDYFARDFVFETVVWDLFTRDQQNELEEKLKTAYPDPDISQLESQIAARNLQRTKDCREAVLTALWNQRKYNNKNLLMSIIFILVTKPDLSDTGALNATDYACFPIFRIRKCRVNEDTTDCCMLFVDDAARVYQNWNDYLENNVLPEGRMVAPKSGIYSLDNSGNVISTVHDTPALTYKVLNNIDLGVGYAGMASAGVTIGGLLFPVTAPVVAVGALVGVASAGWSGVRSAVKLFNRDRHEQSTSISDRQARAHWLGVAGGVVGLGAMSATYGMVRFAAAGENVSEIAQAAVNTLNASALLLNGVSVGNGFVELYFKKQDNEEITALEVAQLGASLFLFTHSVSNFQTASNIIDSTKNGTISQFRNEMSNRQRRMFDKMAKETVRVRGNNQGKSDIIRGLKNIPDNKYFNDVYKVNKQLNKNNVRPSFAPDGKVALNNKITVDSATLRSNLQHGIGEPLLNRAGAIPEMHSDGRPNNFYGNINANSANRVLQTVVNGINGTNISNITDIQNLILNILSKFSEEILEILIDIANAFMRECMHFIHENVSRYIDFDEVLQSTFKISLNLTRGNPVLMSQCYLIAQRSNILEKLKNLFLESNPSSNEGRKKCTECRGYQYICSV